MFKNIRKGFAFLYRSIIFTVLCILTINLGIVVYIQKDYEADLKKEDSSYLNSVYTYMERDINVRIPEMILSLFRPEDYWKYYSAYENETSKNVQFVRLQNELQRALYAAEGIYDCAMYYPQTNELISATRGYLQLSRSKNKEYSLAYNIEETEKYHWGINTAVSNSQSLGILLTVTYKFENESMLIYGLGKEYFDSFFIGTLNNENNMSGVFVLDKKNENIYDIGTSMDVWSGNAGFYDAIDKASVAGPQRLRNDGSSFILTAEEGDTLPLRFIKINQEHIIGKLKNYLFLLYCFIFLLLIAILIGMIIPNYLAEKVYKPIYKLAGHIGEDSEFSNITPHQLLQEIGNYVVTSKSELHEIRQVLANSRNAIEEHFIKYIFSNTEPEDKSIQEYTSVLKLEWPQGIYFSAYLLLEPSNLSNVSVTELLLIKTQLIYELGTNDTANLHILSCNYTENSLAIMILTGENTWHRDLEMLDGKIAGFLEPYNIGYFLSIGPGQQMLRNLSLSAKVAKKNMVCHFYANKDISYCIADDIRSIDCAPPPLQLICSDTPSLADIRLLIDTTKEFFIKYPFESEHCKKTLALFVSLILNYIQNQDTLRDTPDISKIMYPVDHFWKANDYFQFLNNLFINQEDTALQEPEDVQQKIIRYIENNLNNNISLESIAEHVHLSPKYVSKIFKQKTGQNLTAYITNLRIEQALDLLKYTDKNIETIAQETGFSSSNYFIKCFKSKMGMSPKAYRETLSNSL